MFKISPLIRISSGLVFLTVSILLLADLIGISPNNANLVVDERRKFSEFLTIQVMTAMESGQEGKIPSIMNVVSERNEDVLSMAIRKNDGDIVLEIGEHLANWNRTVDEGSTANFMQVPVFKEGQDWGRIELRYKPINKVDRHFDLPIDNSMLLTIFVGFFGYLLYFFFLKRTLKHLDPTSVIPSRVRNAMDALSEGVVILDGKENIILANSSICHKLKMSEKKLVGRNINKFSWQMKNINKNDDETYPWKKALNEKRSISSVELFLDLESEGTRTYMVNASPVEDGQDKITGLLCTFDDVTHIEEKNSELESAMALLKKSQVQINKKNKELSILASTDPLTECLNRRAFFEIVNAEFEVDDTDNMMSCIMLDIDFFKKVNDDYGHTVGDTVIRALADTLKSTLRERDLLCRYGGEEFCVILRDTSADVAQNLAERVRTKVEALKFLDSPATEKMKITASFGITDISYKASSVEELIDQADQALYFSKENGRNQVTLWKDVVDIEISGVPETNVSFSGESQGDILTGLPGRQGFLKVISDSISSNGKEDDLFAVILIDIDMFKRINSSMGSSQGDLVLQQFANRLNSIVRDSDILAYYDDSSKNESIVSRVGGNEFAILARQFDIASNVHVIANRLLETLSQPYLLGDTDIYLTFSIGISLYPTDGDKGEELISRAEQALFRAKKEEGNTYRRYKKDVDVTSRDVFSIENELRNAIKNQDFVLYYQPKIDLTSNVVNSVEALVRWNHPTKGIISPMEFISIAEQSGLIHEIGKQIMEIAFRQTVDWVAEGYTSIRVAINISAMQLQKPDFLEQTYKMLDKHQCNPGNIEFELTETVLVENIDTILPILESIHDKGIKISIDDFGVGYSSLNYVKRLPVDYIKIDKSFIDDVHTNHDDETLVSAMIAMAHAMHLGVVAEGVENKQQLNILQKLKCDYIQGFYFSQPMLGKDISTLLNRVKQKISALAS